MANQNFGVQKYATLEINRASFLKDGLIVSQTPLGSGFTASAPCENGMWVDANKANGAINAPTSSTKLYGIVYTTEKEYNDGIYGMKHFCQIAGQYPRVGILKQGDTFTTNCFQYDTTEFANDAAVKTALAAVGSTPLYLVAVNNSGRPKLTASAPNSGFYAQVIKGTTVPNGEVGIKYNVVVEA